MQYVLDKLMITVDPVTGEPTSQLMLQNRSELKNHIK